MNRFSDLSLRALIFLVFLMFLLPVVAEAKDKNTKENKTMDNSLAAKFCGTWQYDGKNDGAGYLKIVREGQDRFKFSRGYKYKGDIVWEEPMLKNTSAIYLKPSNGKLQAKFISGNFYATHGKEFTYKITLELKSDNKLLYSVWSSIRKETDTVEATKISN